ncbi:MAG: DUF2188 domain-containing protein [Candidatus Thermoplasmatota archaeon]|nr:DUF2188 domain-containing protein [Candidatus Thermoplasmatota archaeon]
MLSKIVCIKNKFLSIIIKPFKEGKKDKEIYEPIGEESLVLDQKDSNDDQSVGEDVVEYREVLYSDRPDQVYTKKSYDHKLLFTDVKTLESDIDNIDKKRAAENGSIEKKVDFILSKKKEPVKKPSSRKPPNVIYVVSKPQPGQVKGDWAVRSHYKIFSHHRTKQAAIKKARTIALQKDATVLVQNTDGTFSDGFKPRAKKK